MKSKFLSIVNLWKSSSIRNSKGEEVLFVLKTFLNKVFIFSFYLDFAIKPFIEEEYDINIIKETTIKKTKKNDRVNFFIFKNFIGLSIQ